MHWQQRVQVEWESPVQWIMVQIMYKRKTWRYIKALLGLPPKKKTQQQQQQTNKQTKTKFLSSPMLIYKQANKQKTKQKNKKQK